MHGTQCPCQHFASMHAFQPIRSYALRRIGEMHTVGLLGSDGFCVGPLGRLRTSRWLSSSKVGEKGDSAVTKLKICVQQSATRGPTQHL